MPEILNAGHLSKESIAPDARDAETERRPDDGLRARVVTRGGYVGYDSHDETHRRR